MRGPVEGCDREISGWTGRAGRIGRVFHGKTLGKCDAAERGDYKAKITAEVKTAADNYLKRRKNVAQWPNKQLEPELVRAIVDYRSRLHKEDVWRLSRTGTREVASDFNLIHDDASQMKDLDVQPEVYGSLFLTQAQSAEIKSKSDEEDKVYLESHAADKLDVLWYFVVSLCRLLQTKDLQTNTGRGVLARGG